MHCKGPFVRDAGTRLARRHWRTEGSFIAIFSGWRRDRHAKAIVLERLDVDSILLDAWQDFAKYDKNANRQQFLHFLIQLAILVVGVALTMGGYFYENNTVEKINKGR